MHSFPILNLSIGWAHPERWPFTTNEGERKLTQLQRPNREYNSGLPCAVKITSQLSAMYSSNLHVYPTFNRTIFVYPEWMKLYLISGLMRLIKPCLMVSLTALIGVFWCLSNASAGREPSSRIFFVHSSFCWIRKCKVLVATRDKRLCNQRAHAVHVTRDLFFWGVIKSSCKRNKEYVVLR